MSGMSGRNRLSGIDDCILILPAIAQLILPAKLLGNQLAEFSVESPLVVYVGSDADRRVQR